MFVKQAFKALSKFSVLVGTLTESKGRITITCGITIARVANSIRA